MRIFRTALSAAVALAVGATAYSVAPLAGAQAIEEVVVTARKREESLQEIPVAISAFTGEKLSEVGVRSLVDVAKFTPGLQFNEQGVQEPGRIYTAIRFRGLGSEIKEPFGQIGSAFLDGIYMSSGVSAIGAENLERIEVVKGPSSAWLGRSTFAGAVNFITKTPSLQEYSGRITTRFAEDSTYDVTFAHEGPIIADKLGYRVYGRGYGTGGQYTASDGGALGEETTQTIMATLYAEPTDNLSIKFRAMVSQDEDGAAPGAFVTGPLGFRGTNTDAPTNCLAQNPSWATLFKRNDPSLGTLTDWVCGEIPGADSLRGIIDQNTVMDPQWVTYWNSLVPQVADVPYLEHVGLEREQERFSLAVDYEIQAEGFLEGATISFLAGSDEELTVSVRDFDVSRFNNWLSRDPQIIETEQYELRIASNPDRAFTWLLGVSYFDAEFNSQFSGGEVIVGGDGGISLFGTFDAAFDLDVIFGGETDRLCPCGFPPLDPPPKNSGETTGIFGSLGYKFNEAWSVQFDFRSQEDKIRAQAAAIQQSFDFIEPYVIGQGEIGLELGQDFDAFLPRFTVQFQPSDSTNLWATYSEGNNPGFFNLDLITRPEEDINIILAQAPGTALFADEEEITNFEIGWKQTAWDNRLNFSAVIYQMEWENQKTRQGQAFTRPDQTQGIANLVVGGFNTDLQGIELEGTAAITETFAIDFSLNWADAEFQNFECGFTDDFTPPDPGGSSVIRCDGNRPVQFPEWSGSIAGTLQDSLNADWDYFVRLDGNYTGKRFVDEQNFAFIGAHWIWNLRAGFQKDDLRIEGFVTNLADDDTWLAGNRWSDFSATQGTLFPFEFGFQQGIALTAPQQRQIGIRLALDF